MSKRFIMKTDFYQFRSQVFTSGMTHLDLNTCYKLHFHKKELKISTKIKGLKGHNGIKRRKYRFGQTKL